MTPVRLTLTIVGITVGVAVVGFVGLMVFGFLAYAGFFSKPTVVRVAALENATCQVVGANAYVTVTIVEGPEYESDFYVGVRRWSPDSVPFSSSLPTGEPVEMGDTVAVVAPLNRSDEISGLEMLVARGEPGYAQTIPLTISSTGAECSVNVPD